MNKTLKKTLSIILAILMIATTIPFAFAAESDGVKTTLDVSKGYIVIADSYVTWGSETVEVDPDGYIITGTAWGDTPLKFINDSGSPITFDLVFDNLSLTAAAWCSVISIKDNSPVTLDIECKGSNAITSYNHSVFNNACALTSITINITKTEGSSITLKRQSAPEDGIVFNKDDTKTFVYINGIQLNAAAECDDYNNHKSIDGIQYCKGYLCDTCGQCFGEKDETNHYSDGVQYCKGYKCEFCDVWYGEAGDEHIDEDGNAFCDGCDEFAGKEIEVGDTYTVTKEEYVKFVPTVSGTYVLSSSAVSDPYVTLYDSDLALITVADDNDGNNFSLEYDYEAGKTYYFYFFDWEAAYNYTVIFKCKTHTGGTQTCMGYKCENCGEWYGEVLGHTDADGDYLCDNGCGSELAVIGGETYVVLGDITYTGLNYNKTGTPGCYKAGDGYAVIQPADAGTELILYNATIDVREEAVSGDFSENNAVSVYGDLNVTFIATNNIYAKEGYNAFLSVVSSDENTQLVINGAEGAVLNLYGKLIGGCITVKSGTVNVYQDDPDGIVAISAINYFTVEKDAVVTAVGAGNELFPSIGVTSQRGMTIEGVLNAFTLELNAEEFSAALKVFGDVTAQQDIDGSLVAQEGVSIDLVIPEGSSLTVPEGCTINLDSFNNVEIKGKLIVNGTLICTHKGGTATCTEKAVCDVCGREYGEVLGHTPLEPVKENEVAPECEKAGSYDLVVYCDVCDEELDRDTTTVDALTHTDADGDYLCDNGCGHEFEKPVDPTPDEPADDTCDHICHSDNALMKFLWKIISFFFRLFNIQQYCDCGVLHYDAPVFG